MAGPAVHDAVQPALAGPGFDQREPGLGLAQLGEIAFQPHHELGLRDGGVAEVAFHQRRVEAQVERGQQPDRPRALQVAVEREKVCRRQARVVVHRRPLLLSFVRTPNIGHRADKSGAPRSRVG